MLNMDALNNVPLYPNSQERSLTSLGSVEKEVDSLFSVAKHDAVRKAVLPRRRSKERGSKDHSHTSIDAGSGKRMHASRKSSQHRSKVDHDMKKLNSEIGPKADQSSEYTQTFDQAISTSSEVSKTWYSNRAIKKQEWPTADHANQLEHRTQNHFDEVQARAMRYQPSNGHSSLLLSSAYSSKPLPKPQARDRSEKWRVSPRDGAAAAQYLVNNGQLYWNLDLSGPLNPFHPVMLGYGKMLLLIDSLLQGDFRKSILKPQLRDVRNQIEFMKQAMEVRLHAHQSAWKLVKYSEKIRNMHGDQRIESRRKFALYVHHFRKSIPIKSFVESQNETFYCYIGLMGLRRYRGIASSPRLREILRLCRIICSKMEGLTDYLDLLTARYLRCNNGKDLVDPYLSNSIISSNGRALCLRMRNLRLEWQREMDGVSPYRTTRRAFILMHRGLRKSMEELRPLLLWYKDRLLDRWASCSLGDTADFIPESDGDNNYDLCNEGPRGNRRDLNATDHNRPLRGSTSSEYVQLDSLPQSSSADFTVGLNIQPTQRLAQEYVPSFANASLRTSNDVWITRPGSSNALVKESGLTWNGQGPIHITDGRGGALNDDVVEEPHQHHLSPLGYHIPATKLAEAKLASTGTTMSYWQYLLYRGPRGEKIKVHYCKSKATTERIAQLFLNQEVLGFDIEWKPQALTTEGVKKNVALIQLATEERIALFHIARYWEDEKSDDLLAPTLKKIMESASTTKVGVSIKADCTRLRKFMGVDARGLFELSHLYKLVRFSRENVKLINKKLVSLSQQVEEHLQLPMWKGEVRSSDWSQELNYEQIYCEYLSQDSSIVP